MRALDTETGNRPARTGIGTDLTLPFDNNPAEQAIRMAKLRIKDVGPLAIRGQNASVASIYRVLAEHAKQEAYPEAVEQAHADFAALSSSELPGPRAEPETVR